MGDRRAGFTLVEVVVVIGILVLIGAVLVPAVAGGLDSARIRSSAETLEHVALAIHNPARDVGSFRTHVCQVAVCVRPSQLSQLTAPIAIDQLNSCGAVFTAAQVAAWSGPYVNRAVTASGVPIPIGTVQNDLVRDSVPDVTAVLKIRVLGVALDDAQALARRVDGFVSDDTGTVQWSAPDTEGLVTLDYVSPVLGC